MHEKAVVRAYNSGIRMVAGHVLWPANLVSGGFSMTETKSPLADVPKNEEVRRLRSVIMKELIAAGFSPGEALGLAPKDPRLREAFKFACAPEEFRARLSTFMAARGSSEENKAKISHESKMRWAEKDSREQMVRGLKAARNRVPEKEMRTAMSRLSKKRWDGLSAEAAADAKAQLAAARRARWASMSAEDRRSAMDRVRAGRKTKQ